jgi:hypothetical protein
VFAQSISEQPTLSVRLTSSEPGRIGEDSI